MCAIIQFYGRLFYNFCLFCLSKNALRFEFEEIKLKTGYILFSVGNTYDIRMINAKWRGKWVLCSVNKDHATNKYAKIEAHKNEMAIVFVSTLLLIS